MIYFNVKTSEDAYRTIQMISAYNEVQRDIKSNNEFGSDDYLRADYEVQTAFYMSAKIHAKWTRILKDMGCYTDEEYEKRAKSDKRWIAACRRDMNDSKKRLP